MAGNIWEFGVVKDTSEAYADGTVVPHRYQAVLLNGKEIGYVEIHMHKRLGSDGIADVSFGITNVVYGPVQGGK